MPAKLNPKHIAANRRVRVYKAELEKINQKLTDAGVPRTSADGWEIPISWTSVRVSWAIQMSSAKRHEPYYGG